MLQINNLEGKSDWLNETQLIMVENEISEKEIEGISKNTITLNSIEASDQTLLLNANGQTFVIGLDHSLFENYSKSDLLFMSNSDLKLLPSVTDSKLTYSVPSIEQSKSEIVWENNAFEKPLMKDILNVIQETSKGWQEIGKNTELCLDDINSVEVHDSKLNADFLIEPHVTESKKMRTDNSDQYIVGYYPVADTCDTVLVPASLMTLEQKPVSNNEQLEKTIVIRKNIINTSGNQTELFVNDNSIGDGQSTKWMKSESENRFTDGKMHSGDGMPSLKVNNAQQNSLILAENINNISENMISMINTHSSDFINAKSENVPNFNREKCIGKNDVGRGESENSTLPEQSLPLKKKAKMKKSPAAGNLNFLSEEAVKCGQNYTNVENGNVVEDGKESETKIGYVSEASISRSKRKVEGNPPNMKKRKNFREENVSESGNWSNTGIENINQNEIRYKNVTELLEQLRNEKFINDTLFKMLCTGLEEMDVDVLQEMYDKRNDISQDYSSQLKAFALMIHFKQPAAFSRLRKIFQNGWPSLAIIKDWKRRLNSCRRPKIKK